MEKRFEFTGTGGALLGKFLVGLILTSLTLGIYTPWFIVSLQKYICENLTLKTEVGDVKFQFNGSGGALLGTYFVGAILTGLTLGIYMSWFIVNLSKYFTENTQAQTADGTPYALQFNGTGGGLFGTVIVGAILTSLTFGIYGAWFVVKLAKFFADNLDIMSNGTKVGSITFNGQGGELLGTYLVGIILTSLTLGIYGAWFTVNIMKYVNKNTEVTINEKSYVGDFVGTGGAYFALSFVGSLLTFITFGIYGAWYMCNLLKFQYENIRILDKA